ncbi:mucolipin-3-like [Stylophora pistillata]|uniref:Mucolipin-3 n=1 Tax=Stylophora pistillata TaxID=50429 RepID=A0A2B4RUF4_STYPI|nr:mucolipin-3-like [Stylophora pistillata]PFX20439.1 Mucolipin-3 [Stylophora pistillata]
MTSPNKEISRKPSVARSYTSELGTVQEEQTGDETDQTSVSERSIGGQQTQDDSSSGFDEGDVMASLQSSPSLREILKTKIRYHYMNPFQKFRARRRKPWKLVVQIVKVALVTLQICLFGLDRFSLVTFLDHNRDALRHFFLKDYQGKWQDVVVYTREQLYDYLHYAHEQYYEITSAPLGTYNYTTMNGTEPPKMKLCYSYYKKGGIVNNTYVFDPNVTLVCFYLGRPVNHEHIITNKSFNLGRLRHISLKFSLKTVNVKNVKAWDKPACYQLNVTITFDNVKHDGRMPVDFDMTNIWLECVRGKIKGQNHLRTHFITVALVMFDYIVISICSLSLVLCARSIYKSLKLAKEAASFFKNELLEDFTFSDYQEFVSLWVIVIMSSDVLTIVGSVYKMAIDQKDSDFYDVSSIFLGTAVLLVWIGLLRFLGYSKKYNVLLETLKAATPSMARFFVCVILIFVGFMFCGWIVFGPFHPKFKTLDITAECLYSMINGDDLYYTYAEITRTNSPLVVWIFSKIYIYIFIALFIYVVLSLFIGIIADTYERLKDMGHVPETKIQRFLREPANVGRTVQSDVDYTPETTPTTEAITAPTQREGTSHYGRTRSTSAVDAIMRNFSLDSTGVE